MAGWSVADVLWMAGPRASEVSVSGRRTLARHLRCARSGAFPAALRACAEGDLSRGRRDDREHAYNVGSVVAGARGADDVAGAVRSTASPHRAWNRAVRIEVQRYARDAAGTRRE